MEQGSVYPFYHRSQRTLQGSREVPMEGHLRDQLKHEGWHLCFNPNCTAHWAISGVQPPAAQRWMWF